jgi:PIN domain
MNHLHTMGQRVALIYLDTNIYLEFYRSAKEPLSIFKEIEEYASRIVITKQTVDEFFRNRVLLLGNAIKQIEEWKAPVVRAMHTTDLVREMSEYDGIKELQNKVKSLTGKITNTLSHWKQTDADDPVLVQFRKIIEKATFYDLNFEIVQRARDRKDLGNPPTSDNKTMGDEVIWETLLSSLKDDLIVVSRDKTFITHSIFLRDEFKKISGRELLLITESPSAAFKEVGVESERLENAEIDIAEQDDFEARAQRTRHIAVCETRARKIDPEIRYFGSVGQYANHQILVSLRRFRDRLKDVANLNETDDSLMKRVDEIITVGKLPSELDESIEILQAMRNLVDSKKAA